MSHSQTISAIPIQSTQSATGLRKISVVGVVKIRKNYYIIMCHAEAIVVVYYLRYTDADKLLQNPLMNVGVVG